MSPRLLTSPFLLLVALATTAHADDFDNFLKPLFARHCQKCHGEKKVKGKVNLKELTSLDQFLGKPKLIEEMIEVIDANDMPPEKEPRLDPKDRARLLGTLRTLLRDATAGKGVARVRMRRLNRFQYNNSLKDLFRLNRDVFPLPEKLMTRHRNYITASSGRMPDRVDVSCRSLDHTGGFRDVNPFPKDLRAAHAFDNQANQLTLSPLLLDSFLKLSVSILESPDFTPRTVGVWNDFFKAPADGSDMRAEVRQRLGPFLRKAFRSPVEKVTVDRYTDYTLSKLKQGLPFTESMKKVASAALSSPMFLYRYRSTDPKDRQIELASRLSYFLWASGPDTGLLDLAGRGELAKPEILNRTLQRMLADPKIERFLDTFPAQWMQLENVLGATPDPKKHRLFSLDPKKPAGVQMVLEPLLLFDAVFVEDRPITELITPSFSYQSDFLKTWYTSDLEPPKVDAADVAAANRASDEKRASLEEKIADARAEREALTRPVRERLLAEKKKDSGNEKPVDLKPYAAWEFNGDLKDSIRSLDLKAHGRIRYQNGRVVLDRAHLKSPRLPIELKAKTLEVWITLKNVKQRGGGAMTVEIEGGGVFDSIVLGERKPRHWISGSDNFNRTQDIPGSTPEDRVNELIHLALVTKADGTITLYRDGLPYGRPYRMGPATFPANRSVVVFGLRHSPPGGNKFLAMSLDRARLYDRALTAEEVAASASGNSLFVSNRELVKALTDGQKKKWAALGKTLKQLEADLKKVPKKKDLKRVKQEVQKRFDDEIRKKMSSRTFERVAASDPRYGGVITNAAMLSMTSGPKRTHPIARGAWIIEVIFNDPPPPPPNNVPPLKEGGGSKNLTIRERFARHRENPDCAGCHSRLDPLGFALENFGITGRWRDKYENNRDVDASGTIMKKHAFTNIVDFKKALVAEDRRFAKAFTAHLLRFALSRELGPADSVTVEKIVARTANDGFRLKSILREIVCSDSFVQN